MIMAGHGLEPFRLSGLTALYAQGDHGDNDQTDDHGRTHSMPVKFEYMDTIWKGKKGKQAIKTCPLGKVPPPPLSYLAVKIVTIFLGFSLTTAESHTK